MAEQMIIMLKQKIIGLQQIYAVIQKEFELIAMHSQGTDTGYNEMSDCVKEVVHSLDELYNSLNQENPGMYQDLNSHPETIKEIKSQMVEMEVAATELQQGNRVWLDSIIKSGAKQEQINSNQMKEE